MENIRNFCIIAHIDHGKSTLADRLIQRCGAVEERDFRDQILDSMDIERERGITIKSNTVSLLYTARDGAEIHLKVLELLTAIKPFFSTFKIEDEGEYWETGDLRLLTEHMDQIQNVIEEELQKDPSARTKFKTPSGRMIDLMR